MPALGHQTPPWVGLEKQALFSSFRHQIKSFVYTSDSTSVVRSNSAFFLSASLHTYILCSSRKRCLPSINLATSPLASALDENSLMADSNAASCPFCPFTDSDANFVSQHIEFCHPETGVTGFLQETPQEFATQISASLPEDEEGADKYVNCPHECGEMIKIAELSSHLDLHAAEAMALDDFGATSARSTADVHDHGYDGLFDEDSLDILDSHKGGKRGMQRDSSRVNTAKPPRPHSPLRTTNADGIKRLGVYVLYLHS